MKDRRDGNKKRSRGEERREDSRDEERERGGEERGREGEEARHTYQALFQLLQLCLCFVCVLLLFLSLCNHILQLLSQTYEFWFVLILLSYSCV